MKLKTLRRHLQSWPEPNLMSFLSLCWLRVIENYLYHKTNVKTHLFSQVLFRKTKICKDKLIFFIYSKVASILLWANLMSFMHGLLYYWTWIFILPWAYLGGNLQPQSSTLDENILKHHHSTTKFRSRPFFWEVKHFCRKIRS